MKLIELARQMRRLRVVLGWYGHGETAAELMARARRLERLAAR